MNFLKLFLSLLLTSLPILKIEKLIGLNSNQSEQSSMKSFISDIHLKSILPDDNNKPTFHHNNQIYESQIDPILIFIPDSCDKVSVQFSEHLCQKE